MLAYLKLETGQVFPGHHIGAHQSVVGEVVFLTGMVGYPEALTDPSYRGQIVVFTYPMIGNYGVPDPGARDEYNLLKNTESEQIQVSAMVVGEYVEEYSHWNAKFSLGDWLVQQDIPGIAGIDTRALTQIIREHGVVRGQIYFDGELELARDNFNFDFSNLVPQVSTKSAITYNTRGSAASVDTNSTTVLVIDCGIKHNQIRLLLDRGADVIRVPWDCDFLAPDQGLLTIDGDLKFDRVFISNGPGNPTDCQILIDRLRRLMQERPDIPVFGICLGHQLLALAAGAETYKMKYGNRGLNIPCQLTGSLSSVITTQNHGYAVRSENLPDPWKPLFTNANDGSNEGIYHSERPYFSVQFHPEGRAGPRDTEFLFDMFLQGNFADNVLTIPEQIQQYLTGQNQNTSLSGSGVIDLENRKVLVLGSGGLSIGQSGEFDYSGSQAIKAYKEAGLTTILINPNVATVQTSPGFADKVYLSPVTPDWVIKVIKVERPDYISLSFGGQTALNCGVELERMGVFKRYQIQVLGTQISSVQTTEDRQMFKEMLQNLSPPEPVIQSQTAHSDEEALIAAEKIGYPVLVRAAYALGGMGSGFAKNRDELRALVSKALAGQPDTEDQPAQVIIDQSLKGWKEVEYEVVRDQYDNCICVCNMENLDPLGVHTGESIVVAPSQTLDDQDYFQLRAVALKVIRALKVVGECNIQFTLDPESRRYYIIEVNARLSRSSALASKATGYPLAYVAAKLSLGYGLSELKNLMTKTSACFEPSLDYCVVKVPRWDLAKFPMAQTGLNSAMKSIGEAMAIDRSFEAALQKALRMVEDSVLGLTGNDNRQITADELENPTPKRLAAVADAFYQDNLTIDEIGQLTRIDYWFLAKIERIIKTQKHLEQLSQEQQGHELDTYHLRGAKCLGFCDSQIAKACQSTELAVRKQRLKANLMPVVKQIDTVAAEFPCYTNYLYLTYSGNTNDVDYATSTSTSASTDNRSVMVLGSGVYKIGSSVEFDWSCVNCIRELRSLGYQTALVNCNPETVSTDYDEADRLYFEELSLETVMDLYQLENGNGNKHDTGNTSELSGMILSMGGQIPNNIAMPLYRQGVKILGTSPEMIDNAENRFKFSRLLDTLNIDQPKWRELTSVEQAQAFCQEVGYPCLIRPSYVLSGQAMMVVYTDTDLQDYLRPAGVSNDYPVVISKYMIDAKEIEVDAVAQQGEICLMTISEHVENAGVHSGDSTLILPAQDLTQATTQRIEASTRKIAQALKIQGPFNIQFMAKDDQLKVIECNLRVSRTYPFVSKTMGLNMARTATRVIMGIDQRQIKKSTSALANNSPNHRIGVKVPKFSFSRLPGADVCLGVDMQSTGEVACFGQTPEEAFLKAWEASELALPRQGSGVLLSIGSYRNKNEFLQSVQVLSDIGYQLYGTRGTTDFYQEQGINIQELDFGQMEADRQRSRHRGLQTFEDCLREHKLDLIINLSRKDQTVSKQARTMGYQIRRKAVDHSVPLVIDIKFAKLLVRSLQKFQENGQIWINTTIDCLTSYKTIRLPGLIDVHTHLREPGAEYKEDFSSGTQAALAGGITAVCAMPNTDPAITSPQILSEVKKLAKTKAYCDYAIFLGANSENWQQTSATRLTSSSSHQAAALKMYLNNTYGPLLLEKTSDWAEHVRNWPESAPGPICVHAEAKTLPAILHLANLLNKRIHVCHLARREEIELVKMSKEAGMRITCEVAPHHLFLCEENLKQLGSCGEVKPNLVTQDDQDALWENMDYIDCFATDHAPHLLSEKRSTDPASPPPPGFPGLETALPLLLTAVHHGRLTIEQIIEKYHNNPIKIFNLPKQPDTYIEVDLDHKWQIPQAMTYSKSGWTPFAGREVVGQVRRVVLRGKVVYVDGQILAQPGYGQDLRQQSMGSQESVTSTATSITSTSMSPTTSLSTTDNGLSQLRNVLSTEQFDRTMLKALFERTDQMRDLVLSDGVDPNQRLKNKVLGSIFYEASTRTRCSFSAAMKRLGGTVIEISASDSSVAKGESFQDFVSCIECYTDAIVVRNSQAGSLDQIKSQHPMINAGDGVGEHPTQALQDIYTIREERGTVTGLTVALVGDLKHGRTVHSLAKLLALYDRVRLRYISPPGLEMPYEVKQYVAAQGVEQTEHQHLETTNNSGEAILDKIDILYMTRIQRERFSSKEEYEKHQDCYRIEPKSLIKAKSNLVIMHPLPRNREISPELDTDPRAAYFRQMKNGMYLRMALLDLLLK